MFANANNPSKTTGHIIFCKDTVRCQSSNRTHFDLC